MVLIVTPPIRHLESYIMAPLQGNHYLNENNMAMQAQKFLKREDGGGTSRNTLLRGKYAFQIFVTYSYYKTNKME
jgi:hypothetical protein